MRRAGHRVTQHGVSMAEGAPLDIFASQPNGRAVFENRRIREFLGGGPIDSGRGDVKEGGPTVITKLLEFAMNHKTARRRHQAGVEIAQTLDRHRRDRRSRGARWRDIKHRFDEILVWL